MTKTLIPSSSPSNCSGSASLASIFSNPLLKSRVISFLDVKECFRLREISRYFLWTISLNYKYTLGLVDMAFTKMKEEVLTAKEFESMPPSKSNYYRDLD